MKNAPAPRTIKTAKSGVKIPAPLINLAREAYTHNQDKNRATKGETEARKSLYSGMKEAKIASFSTEGYYDGRAVQLDVEIATPEGNAVDIQKLAALVTHQQLMQIVTATQKAVTDIAGEAILRQCLVSVKGTENVTVKVLK